VEASDAKRLRVPLLEPAILSRGYEGIRVFAPSVSKVFGGFTLWRMEVGEREGGIENGSSAGVDLGGNMESGRGSTDDNLGRLEGRCQHKGTTIAVETALRIMAPKVTPTSTAIVVPSLSFNSL